MGRKYDLILVTIDQGPGQVPHGQQGSGRGSVGECQLGVNDQFFNKTGTNIDVINEIMNTFHTVGIDSFSMYGIRHSPSDGNSQNKREDKIQSFSFRIFTYTLSRNDLLT